MNMIVMMDETGCIGINGEQPIHLNEDLKRFRKFTLNKIIVCGRKTLQTFPNALPLENRSSIIVSNTLNQANYLDLPDRNIMIVSDPFTVIKLLKNMNSSNVWVIGGASIYKELLPWTTRVFVTHVHTKFKDEYDIKMEDMSIYDKNMKQNDSKVYFPIDVLDAEFEAVESTNINDYDKFTGVKYKTTFTEYIRL